MTDTERAELLKQVRELTLAAADTHALATKMQALLVESQAAIEGAKLVISLLCEEIVRLEGERDSLRFRAAWGARA